jgi:hypothetical protein
MNIHSGKVREAKKAAGVLQASRSTQLCFPPALKSGPDESVHQVIRLLLALGDAELPNGSEEWRFVVRSPGMGNNFFLHNESSRVCVVERVSWIFLG